MGKWSKLTVRNLGPNNQSIPLNISKEDTSTIVMAIVVISVARILEKRDIFALDAERILILSALVIETFAHLVWKK